MKTSRMSPPHAASLTRGDIYGPSRTGSNRRSDLIPGGLLDRPGEKCHRNRQMKTPSASGFAPDLPDSLAAERRGDIALLRLARPHKRNALDDEMIFGIERFFTALPDDIRAI